MTMHSRLLSDKKGLSKISQVKKSGQQHFETEFQGCLVEVFVVGRVWVQVCASRVGVGKRHR